MTLPIRPIVSAILVNRIGAALVAFQIALALALLVNATQIVRERVAKIDRPTGVDVENVIVVKSQHFTERFDHRAAMREDLDYLRRVPGVLAATATSHAPLAGAVFDIDISVQPGERIKRVLADYYEVDHQAIEALGLRLVAGRNFEPSAILPPLEKGAATTFVPEIIVTEVLAKTLFPDGNALGRTIYDRVDSPATIVGIVERMHAGWIDWQHVEHVFLMPRLPSTAFGPTHYLVRTEPGHRDRALRTIEEHIVASNPDRVVEEIRPLEYYEARSYRRDRNMGILLVCVSLMLLMITSLGIFGLATFNVNARTRQIGVRRALGARRRDVVYHFMIENWLITSTGLAVGLPLAIAGGYWLTLQFQLPRLEPYSVAAGAVILWLIGQIAAWQPARRAAAVSPAEATRTV